MRVRIIRHYDKTVSKDGVVYGVSDLQGEFESEVYKISDNDILGTEFLIYDPNEGFMWWPMTDKWFDCDGHERIAVEAIEEGCYD